MNARGPHAVRVLHMRAEGVLCALVMRVAYAPNTGTLLRAECAISYIYALRVLHMLNAYSCRCLPNAHGAVITRAAHRLVC